MKRICLFAGFDKQGIVDNYVVYYVKELSKLADVYYWADCAMNRGELEKLAPYVKSAYAERHEKYDFGSWQELINKIGWEKLAKYDEMVLVNDSCYGPMYPLAPIFVRMEKEKVDFWGMTRNNEIVPHVQSYFLVFNNNVIKSESFQNFFNNIKREKSKMDVVRNYEVENTVNLERNGFKWCAVSSIEQYANPMVFWKTRLEEGIPFLKVCNFTDIKHARQNVCAVKKYILTKTGYDYSLINNHLNHLRFNFTKFVLQQELMTVYIAVKNVLKRIVFLRKIHRFSKAAFKKYDN